MGFLFGFVLGVIVSLAILFAIVYVLFLDKPNEQGQSPLESRIADPNFEKETESEIKRRVTTFSDEKVRRSFVTHIVLLNTEGLCVRSVVCSVCGVLLALSIQITCIRRESSFKRVSMTNLRDVNGSTRLFSVCLWSTKHPHWRTSTDSA